VGRRWRVGAFVVVWGLVGIRVAAATAATHEQRFRVDERAEVVAVLTAGCDGCDWGVRGREAAALRVTVDGQYSQHVILCRGPRQAEYRVLLGALGEGEHVLTVAEDRAQSARSAGPVRLGSVRVEIVPEGDPRYARLAHAPILYARPDTVRRFSDLPLVAWSEAQETEIGLRLRYGIVFSHEDGGTPADRLMATWGRVTDIEYVYDVEIDPAGQVVKAEYQGRDHATVAFVGAREGSHPVLYVVTQNNMVGDRGQPTFRCAPAPAVFTLDDVSREVVMDAHPWTYSVSAREVRRQGRVAANAPLGSGRIPDPRRFAYIEACAEVTHATLAFDVGIPSASGQLAWTASDAAGDRFRIARDGCFRGAVALPSGVQAADVVALRFRAYTRPPRDGEAPLPPGSGAATLRRVNRLFGLDADDLPEVSLFSWSGRIPIVGEGPAVELRVR
jgi:hypothetical protein